MPRSIRWRLTLYHLLAMLGIAALLLGIGLFAFYRSVQTVVEETALARVTEASLLLETGSPPSMETLAPLARGDVYLIVRDATGQILATAGSPPPGFESLDQPVRDEAWQRALASRSAASDTPGELYVYAAPINSSASGADVVEAWKSADAAAEGFLPDVRVLTFLIPAILLIAIGGSWLLVRATLKPVQQLTEAARQIGDESLDQRLPVEHRDEIGNLAMTFNDQLARLELAIRERDDALDQQRRFLADASHELRTPLTAIRGYARVLEGWGLDDPEVARESAAAIGQNAARMSAMVEQLMLLARGDDPDLSPSRTRTDLAALARGAAGDAALLAGDHVHIETNTPETAFAEIDAMQIRQVLDALLDNALKLTPDGGSIQLRVTRSPGIVTTTVTDSGPGIPQDRLPYIFDRFYRADPSRSTPGAGLGLAIAKQIVARHGGSLTAENTPASGAKFTLRLPAGGSTPAASDRPATRHSRPATPSIQPQPAAGQTTPDPGTPAPEG